MDEQPYIAKFEELYKNVTTLKPFEFDEKELTHGIFQNQM